MKFFGKKVPSVDLAPQGAANNAGSNPTIPSNAATRAGMNAMPAPDCAIWNDIIRALDINPRSAK